MTETIYGPPDINVPAFIRNALKSDRHLIFGTAGNEYWYGGAPIYNHSKMDLVWGEIEGSTAYREANFTNWPLTEIEKKHFLAISVSDFNEEAERVFVEPVVVDIGAIKLLQKKRKRFVNWKSIAHSLSRSVKDIENKGIAIDVRWDIEFNPNSIVAEK